MVGDIKHIVIIESLKDSEHLTGRELYDDCIRRKIDYQDKPFTHKYYRVSAKSDFIELLKYYSENASYISGGLLLHFEMHGAENKSGLVLSEDTLITWSELIELFRPINIKTCNQLFITMATCYGRFLYKGVASDKKSPYSGYISASKAVYPEEIIDKYSILFEQLIDDGNLVDAYLEMEKHESNFYYKDSEGTFEDGFKSFLEKFNDPEIKAKFIDDCLIETKRAGAPIPDEEMTEFIFQKALHDTYKIQKEGFNFRDCK